MKVVNTFSNTLVDSDTMFFAEKLIKLKKEKPMWDVVDEIIKWWIKSNPKEWRAHLIELSDLKKTRKNKFASTKDKSLRYVLDMPEKIILIIRKLYDVNECPMDKKWMLTFAKRYPRFLVAEKL